MAWTDPTTRATGDLITASIWNTDIVNNLNDVHPYPGDLKMSAQTADHDAWLLCPNDGVARNVSRTTYADLFAIVGTSFGTGDGSTTFGLPQTGGRVPVLLASGGNTDVNAIGDTDGGTFAARSPRHNSTNSLSASHNLTLPNHAHAHSLTLPNHAHSDTLSLPNHAHSHSLTEPNHVHSHTLTLPNHIHQVTGYETGSGTRVGASDTNNTTAQTFNTDNPTTNPAITGSIGNPTSNPAIGGAIGNPTTLPSIDGSVGNPTTTPAIDGSIGNPTTNPAITGSVSLSGSVGPGGTRPDDTPAYIVVGNMFIHT